MARADEDTQVIQRADDPLSSWTAEEELEEQNGSEPAGPPAGSRSESSLIRTLRAKRAEAVAEHIYDLEVPGYDGLLVLRCGPLSGNELAALADKATNSKSPDRAFNANADLLLRACTEVMGRPAHGAEPETLDTDVGPVRIDHTLAEMIGVEVSSSRELLLKLWDRVPSPEISIGLAAAEYVEWVGEATRTIDDGFLGESATATS